MASNSWGLNPSSVNTSCATKCRQLHRWWQQVATASPRTPPLDGMGPPRGGGGSAAVPFPAASPAAASAAACCCPAAGCSAACSAACCAGWPSWRHRSRAQLRSVKSVAAPHRCLPKATQGAAPPCRPATCAGGGSAGVEHRRVQRRRQMCNSLLDMQARRGLQLAPTCATSKSAMSQRSRCISRCRMLLQGPGHSRKSAVAEQRSPLKAAASPVLQEAHRWPGSPQLLPSDFQAHTRCNNCNHQTAQQAHDNARANPSPVCLLLEAPHIHHHHLAGRRCAGGQHVAARGGSVALRSLGGANSRQCSVRSASR